MGIQLEEMTSVALDWYGRPPRRGQYVIYLEAKGLLGAHEANWEPKVNVEKGDITNDVCSIHSDVKGTD